MKLAYAVTMHKGQEQTVDAANEASYCTSPGQCYVALSLVRDIRRRHLLRPLEAYMISVDPVVSDFYFLCKPERQSADVCYRSSFSSEKAREEIQ